MATRRIVIVTTRNDEKAVIDASRVMAVVPHYLDAGYSTVYLEHDIEVKVKGDPVEVAEGLFGREPT